MKTRFQDVGLAPTCARTPSGSRQGDRHNTRVAPPSSSPSARAPGFRPLRLHARRGWSRRACTSGCLGTRGSIGSEVQRVWAPACARRAANRRGGGDEGAVGTIGGLLDGLTGGLGGCVGGALREGVLEGPRAGRRSGGRRARGRGHGRCVLGVRVLDALEVRTARGKQLLWRLMPLLRRVRVALLGPRTARLAVGDLSAHSRELCGELGCELGRKLGGEVVQLLVEGGLRGNLRNQGIELVIDRGHPRHLHVQRVELLIDHSTVRGECVVVAVTLLVEVV
mmetsp:Transcript_16954/g.59271  ORF Transcript_16954/g.59271 Transcript_16954/m.59271 type:complete len:281 (+) Transcript_16954:298-1140(+)